MINGVSNFELSADTEYLSRQIVSLSPSNFIDCSKKMMVLGCGDGKALNLLALENPDWSFLGVDFNQSYITSARIDAPTNVDYLCKAFSEVEVEPMSFGVVGGCGLFSWISDSDRKDVIELSRKSLEIGGYASFGFDSEFFWGEIKGIREAFLSTWIEFGDRNMAIALIKGLIGDVKFSSKNKENFVKSMFDESRIVHWLYQPHWKPMFPSEVIQMFARAGFDKPALFDSLMNFSITGLVDQPSHLHFSFRRLF